LTRSVVVIGAGPTGVLLTQFLRARGAAKVVLADPNVHKLDRAASLGTIATHRVDRADVAGTFHALLSLQAAAFDVVIDATGRVDVIEHLPLLARNGGRIVYYGVADEAAMVSISPFEIFRRELTILGSFTEVDSFPDALAAFRSGAIRTQGLVTHRFALSDYAAALEALRSDRSAHKIVIVP
jgi:D-arabinitol dehydrogenase (NADP+)